MGRVRVANLRIHCPNLTQHDPLALGWQFLTRPVNQIQMQHKAGLGLRLLGLGCKWVDRLNSLTKWVRSRLSKISEYLCLNPTLTRYDMTYYHPYFSRFHFFIDELLLVLTCYTCCFCSLFVCWQPRVCIASRELIQLIGMNLLINSQMENSRF